MRAAVTIGRAAGGRTYAEFLTHVAGLAVEGTKAWGVNTGITSGRFQTQATGSPSGTMNGSPYLSIHNSAPVSRVAQHGLPSQAELLSQIANAGAIYFQIVGNGEDDTVGLDRNGYASQTAAAVNTVRTIDLIWWDFLSGSAKRCNPFSAPTPTDYSW